MGTEERHVFLKNLKKKDTRPFNSILKQLCSHVSMRHNQHLFPFLQIFFHQKQNTINISYQGCNSIS